MAVNICHLYENWIFINLFLDPDAFPSDDTITCCETALLYLDHERTSAASEFLPQVWHFLVPTWYRQLQIKTQDHIESGEASILSLALKPKITKE